MQVEKKDEEVTHVLQIRVPEHELNYIRQAVKNVDHGAVKNLLQDIIEACKDVE